MNSKVRITKSWLRDLDIDKYKAWLKTNPPFSEIIRISKIVSHIAAKACDRIIAVCKGKKSRSCLWVQEPTSAKPQGIRSTEYPQDWGDHPDANYRYRCERMRENLKDEIAMEQLYYSGLELLKN